MTAERCTHGRCCASGTSGAECQHSAAQRLGAQRLEGAPTCIDIVNDNGGECFSNRGLERRFPTIVDLDKIENRAEHAIDSCKSLGACTGPSFVESKSQGLNSGTPCVLFALGRTVGCFSCIDGCFSLRASGLGRFHRFN